VDADDEVWRERSFELDELQATGEALRAELEYLEARINANLTEPPPDRAPQTDWDEWHGARETMLQRMAAIRAEIDELSRRRADTGEMDVAANTTVIDELNDPPRPD